MVNSFGQHFARKVCVDAPGKFAGFVQVRFGNFATDKNGKRRLLPECLALYVVNIVEVPGLRPFGLGNIKPGNQEKDEGDNAIVYHL